MESNRLKLAMVGLVALTALAAVGCGPSQPAKPTQDAVTEFKGNPKAPSLQEKLRAGVSGAPPPPPTTGGG